MQDRRKQDRGSGDRRTAQRRDTPWWVYLLTFIAAGAVLTGVFSLVY